MQELEYLMPKEFIDVYYGIPKGIMELEVWEDRVQIMKNNKIAYTYIRTVNEDKDYVWILKENQS